MPANVAKLNIFIVTPLNREFQPLKEALTSVLKEITIQSSSHDFNLVSSQRIPITNMIYSEIMRCDLIVADISTSAPHIFYEIGIGQALGKPVILLSQEGMRQIPFDHRSYTTLQYSMSAEGLEEFRRNFHLLLEDFIHSPRRFYAVSPFTSKFTQPPYIIDLEKLGPREFENLCFELIAQMGFRRVEWGKEFREIDVIATLPKKDPDGYEYQELWLISMGQRAPIEMMLDIAIDDPARFLNRMLRSPKGLEELFYRLKIRHDIPVTILLILRREGDQLEFINHRIGRMEGRFREKASSSLVRVRLWDPPYLTNLIQQYPQIAFKYFSEEARVKSKYRKTYQELYGDNAKLTEDLIAIKNQLEEEKKKRFMAERDAAWKDVAFKAAHKLGNPIDAIDTFLQGLKRRIEDKLHDEAIQKASDIEISIEEAKAVIAEFKSLTKAQEIVPRATDLLPLIQQACKMAEENGVSVSMYPAEHCPQVMVDPERISEIFNELVANALHWFDKPEKKITVTVEKTSKKDLPETLDKTNGYLKIRFEDNGCGVSLDNKEKIFAPFFTTHPHGTGLGLSLVKWIIEGHGGQIYENGRSGEGSSFEIFIPIAKKKGRQ